MALTVAEMLCLDSFKGARVVAGDRHLDRKVRAVTVMEVPDVVQWLAEGDVLLTTGYPIMHDTDAQARLVRDLAQVGAAALVIKPRRFIQEIPEVMISTANEFGLVIIEFPSEINFLDVVRSVMARVTALDRAGPDRAGIQRRYLEILMSGEGLKAILDHVVAETGTSACVQTRSGQMLASSGSLVCPLVGDEVEQAAQSPGPGPLSFDSPERTCYPLTSQGILEGFLVLCGIKEEHQVFAESAAVGCALELSRLRRGAEVEHRYRQEFLCALLTGEGRYPEGEIKKRAELVGWDLPDNGMVLVVSGLVAAEAILDVLGPMFAQHENSVAGVVERAVAVVIPASKSDDKTKWLDQKAERLAFVRGLVKRSESLLRGPLRVGVGRSTETLEGLRQSYRTAKQAHDLGGEILGNSYVIHFDDLGVFRILLSRGSDPELEAFCDDVLGALIDHDRRRDTRFIETVSAYLRHNGSKSEAAKALFVHLNTLKHRLRRVEEISKLDLDNPEHRLSMHIALKILSILR